MKPTDLDLLRTPSGPRLSPDGRQVAVTVTGLDLGDDAYRSAIWLVPVDGGRSRQFTYGKRDGSPMWSPDGRWLAFLRADDDTPPQLHVMPVDGGEPRRVCEHPLGVGDPVWSPDSTRIAYVARVPEQGRYERGPDATPPGKEPPRRITSTRYRVDGVGFILDRPNHIFVVDALADGAEPRQLTSSSWDFSAPTWTPDGREVVFASARMDIAESLAGDVFAVAATGGDLRRITRSDTVVAQPAVSPDGATVYFLGMTDLDAAGRTFGLFSVPFDGSAAPTRVTDQERWDLSDMSHEAPLIATKDGVYAIAASRGETQVVRVGFDSREPELLTSGRHTVTGIDVAAGVVVATVATDTSSGEVAVLDDGELRRRSDFGAEFARNVALRPMEELTATAPDGYPVHGWLVKPAGPGPHPVLLLVHGGPHTQWSYVLFDEAQVYAGAGYAVVLGNPRGSSGYGEAHGRAIVGQFGQRDRDDLLALLDTALADPDLDADRVGVLGGSYGGYMTTWLCAHDGHRFRAGISERALNSFDSFTGSSDIGFLFTKNFAGDDPEQVRKQSPLTYVDDISVPMLIIHSEQDWRCPLEQAQRLFVALKERGVETEMLLFPGEGHELSRSGLPSHRLARFDAILDWWTRHLAPAE